MLLKPARRKRASTPNRLPCPDFHHHGTVGIQARCGSRGDAAIHIEAIRAMTSASARFMEANLGLEGFQVGLGDIGRIRNDEVEARVAIGEEIGGNILDAILASMANRITTGNFKRFFRYVGGDGFAHLARSSRVATAIAPEPVPISRTCARSSHRKKSQRYLDQRFGLRPGIRTAGVTSKSREKNSLRPMM